MDRDGKVLEGNDVTGVVCVSGLWPSIARTIYGDHDRYLATYMKPFPGAYFTGDGAVRDKDGYIWITGRVDGACAGLRGRLSLNTKAPSISRLRNIHRSLRRMQMC